MLSAALDALYAAPLEAFIPERKRLVKELRDAGDPAAAAALATVAKPTPAAWAVNHVAREAPGAVERWAASAAMLRDASANPKATGADGLRAAMAAHRASTIDLADEIAARARPGGRPLSPAMLDRAVALLHVAVADAELSQRVVAGRVSEPRSPTTAAADPVPDVDPADAVRAERRAELERQARTGAEEVRRLKTEAVEREAAAMAANDHLLEATRRLRRMESEAAAARHALDDAKARLDAVQAELEDA